LDREEVILLDLQVRYFYFPIAGGISNIFQIIRDLLYGLAGKKICRKDKQ
jgi:hypothetical protein